MSEFAYRFTGSADLYRSDRRGLTASINFLTAHDGFTLNDLVSYNEKHNNKNGENNNDGESHNRSWNCGVEGPTDDPIVNKLRDCQKRNFLTTLFLSEGVPMLVAGQSTFCTVFRREVLREFLWVCRLIQIFLFSARYKKERVHFSNDEQR